AVHALLFGVDERTSDNFVHSYAQIRIGGVLVDAQGGELKCVRRKGRRSTLRDGDDDQPLDEGLLRAIFGGVNAELFASVFGIDHQRLREGGEEVVRGEGRVGELLFAAGGVVHLREKQQSLDDAASALFKPSGRNPRINAALSDLKELNEQIRDHQRSPEEWARHDAEHRRLVELEEKTRADLADTESTRSRLDRYHKALGFVGAWKQKRSELDLLAEVVTLSADADERFREANQKRTLAEAAKKTARDRIEALQTELDMLDVPTALLDEESRIDDLYRRLGSHEKAGADSTVLAGQQRTARDSAKRTIEKLGWELSLDEAGDRRVSEEKKARVRALANRHGEVTQGKTRQQQTLNRLRKRLGELDDKLAGEAKIEEPTFLQDALLAATPALEVEDRLPEQRDEVDRLEREASDALARLPLCEGLLEEVCRLEVPGEETVDQFEQTSRDLANELSKLTEHRETNETEREQTSQDLAALELAESVPTEDELSNRRETRDQGVRLAVRQLSGEELPAGETDDFVSKVGDGTDLASSLQPSVRQADDVADRLRRESNRVAQKSQLIAQLQTLDAESQRLNEEFSSAAQQRSDWKADWSKRWETSGIEPATPTEMRGWLRKHAQLVELAGVLVLASQRLMSDEKRVASLCANLTSELLQQEVDVPRDASLRQLVQAAQKRVDETTAAERGRENLVAEAARLNDEVAQAERDLAVAEEGLGVWLADWKEALKPLGLDANALPEQAEAVLANLDELFRNLDEAKGYRTRIWGIEQTAKEFSQAASDMAKAVAPDLTDRPVEELVAMLNRRLSDAKQVRQQATSLQERFDAETEVIEEADSDLSDSTAVLDALVTEAACDGVAELPSAIEKSRRKKSLEGELAQLETQLAPLCAGQPLLEFVEAAQCEDADRLPSRIEELDAQVATLRGELEEAIAAKERESAVLGQFDASASAAEKADERQALLARLEDDTREYLVTTVASRLLQRAVERYQEKSQGPVLAGASTYFQKLTCGSFEGLKTDYDESGQEVLVGIRPDGGSLPVEAMSDGSRDQLYLALRLGTLDHWFEDHEPIPFIVDDILLTFDDARATAALEVLAGMSNRNQVLFFTHHEHLVELARKASRDNGVDGMHVVTEWDA
ncbi:MAG: AAA family ATPase, partial [Planctomycetales bacterium]|nr:AAA family ATPase [Planctomycetales bacterium]